MAQIEERRQAWRIPLTIMNRSTSCLTMGALAGAALLLAACEGQPGRFLLPSPMATPPLLGGSSSATIYSFASSKSPNHDGVDPKGSLTAVTVGSSFRLLGRTSAGGSHNNCGIIFAVDPDGKKYEKLYDFSGVDGCSPRHDAMIADPFDGQMYSTTQGADPTSGLPIYGNQGQILRFPSSSTSGEITLQEPHVFHGATPKPSPSPPFPYDGAQQHSSFSIDPATHVLYGQSAYGGQFGEGQIYAFDPTTFTYADLHDFSSKIEGTEPHGRIVQLGNQLFGISRKEGTAKFGTVFSIMLTTPPSYQPVATLHNFLGGSDGATSDHGYLTAVPVGGRIFLFGMTQCGGSGTGGCAGSDGGGNGTIFSIDCTSGAYQQVYAFRNSPDGSQPYGSLFYDHKYLYGTTRNGGNYGQGTVFRFSPAPGAIGGPSILYHFSGKGKDGANPIDNVIIVSGSIYGMAESGGEGNQGVIFRMLAPP